METQRIDDPQDIAVVRLLTDVLEKLDIGYAIGGSLASSVYGVVRFTHDADITVEPFEPVGERLFESLKSDFYVSTDAMYQALRVRGSFNVIHYATAFKIDIFVRAENEFQKRMLSRARKLLLGDSAKPLSFVSPEDIILLKLDWYMQSGCVSERQWSDVVGVLAVQADSLDFDYLESWSQKLGLNDLLEKAISESQA